MSDNEKRILRAISDAGVTKVVVIDDALAAPPFTPEQAGGLLDILEGEDLGKASGALGITSADIDEASKALKSNDFDDDSIATIWEALYASFLDRPSAKLDPGDHFKVVKGSNAAAIRPVLKLLSKCNPPVEVTRIGGPTDQIDFKVIKPQIVFLDYYLDEQIIAGEPKPGGVKAKDATAASKKLLERIVSDLPTEGPAVILMSSYADVEGEAEEYRKKISKGRLFSSRFQFVDKNKLSINRSTVEIEQAAAKTILDITQCRAFAVGLNDALQQWRDGVDQAAQNLWNDIGEMELRDFAYLVKFRLNAEGQPLSEYLEWFFGEVLLDKIAGAVEWSHPSFASMDDPAQAVAEPIEGAFDGATDMVAKMFSSLRLDSRPAKQKRTHRLGDLYFVDEKKVRIRAVLTPECDLIERKSGRNAPRMLTVLGHLQPISARGASLSDFIMHGGKSYSVDWDFKEIDVLPFGENGSPPLGTEFAGTLRPLYAYELQRRVLDDIGRIGLAVAPALSFAADSKTFVRSAENVEPLPLVSEEGVATCSVIPSRGGKDIHRVVFHSSFVEKLIEAMQNLNPTDADVELSKWMKRVKTDTWRSSIRRKLCREGATLDTPIEGVVVTMKSHETKLKLAPYCQIVVSSAEANAEAA